MNIYVYFSQAHQKFFRISLPTNEMINLHCFFMQYVLSETSTIMY
jgi:hypothetical protein